MRALWKHSVGLTPDLLNRGKPKDRPVLSSAKPLQGRVVGAKPFCCTQSKSKRKNPQTLQESFTAMRRMFLKAEIHSIIGIRSSTRHHLDCIMPLMEAPTKNVGPQRGYYAGERVRMPARFMKND